MKKQDTSSQQKKQRAIEKKLRKSEQRLKDRLRATQNAQSKATQRLQRAEARVQKNIMRAKRLEERLIEVRLQIESAHDATGPGADLVIIPPQKQLQVEAMDVSDNIMQFPVKDVEEEPAGVQELYIENIAVHPAETVQAETYAVQTPQEAVEARAVAEATEEETRDAAARVQNLTPSADTVQPQDASQPLSEEHTGYPTPEEVARVEEISLAEENIEMAASMSAADAAGVAAANAEAFAEASSARANEARRAAEQADHFLEQVRNAIRDGFMQGEEAEKALNTAEVEATYTHALLADAEAAEERARNEAMNAEAEAEVAEGMSHSANAHARDSATHLDHEDEDHTNSAAATPAVQDEATERLEQDEEDYTSDTDELPAIHQWEHE